MAPKLLLADDSVTIQRVIELTFADEDVQVVTVGDGARAIERIRAERPDIVLADVGMPERDGYEVAAFVKGDPQLSHIPVVLLTGAFEPVDEARAKAVGCDGVLVKPFEPQMVISRVRELLSGQGARASAATIASAISHMDVGSSPDAETRDRKHPEPLDAYFDRLDAAISTRQGAPSSAPRPAVKESDARTQPPAPERPANQLSARPSGGSVAAWDPDLQPSGATDLSQAFAALLAAERGQPIAPSVVNLQPLTEETIDEIVRRVIERMGSDVMRRAVLDAAERLVREEIDRIKQFGNASR